MISTRRAQTTGTLAATAAHTLSREMALAPAERCAALLRERVGASRVIPLGSVVAAGPWRAVSDPDLAVEGLPPEQFFTAGTALGGLLSREVQVDMVDLRTASPDLRARILGRWRWPTIRLCSGRASLRTS